MTYLERIRRDESIAAFVFGMISGGALGVFLLVVVAAFLQ